MQIEFYGASSGNVTGSCHILRYQGYTVLLDCGMIQGGKRAEEKNFDPFPFNPADIDAVILSHAHIDHSGRLPLLTRRGFNANIHTQNASVELCEILLMDSAKLAEYDAQRYNRKNPNKPPKQPLFTSKDAELCLSFFKGYKYDEQVEVLPGLKITYRDAGHILGSAIVEIEVTEQNKTQKVVFSGDIGQYNTPILRDPTPIKQADLVIMESTYGGRTHRNRDLTIKEMGEVFKQANAEQGNVIIPAFSVGRTQEILYQFVANFESWSMQNWNIYLDSPMAIKASKIYWNFTHLHDEAAKYLLGNFSDKIPLPNYERSVSTEESKELNKIESGAVFIAGSGMCNGGRILHHLRHNLSNEKNHIIIVGYQSNGTLGRRLVNREPTVKIYGQTIEVKAQIHTIGGLSAHADQGDLTAWIKSIEGKPPVYLVHGEEESQQTLKKHLKSELDLEAYLPTVGQTIDF